MPQLASHPLGPHHPHPVPLGLPVSAPIHDGFATIRATRSCRPQSRLGLGLGGGLVGPPEPPKRSTSSLSSTGSSGSTPSQLQHLGHAPAPASAYGTWSSRSASALQQYDNASTGSSGYSSCSSASTGSWSGTWSGAGTLPSKTSGRQLDPLWEEAVSGKPLVPLGAAAGAGAGAAAGSPSGITLRMKPQVPWWEIATRRSRYRSCPTLQAHVVSAFEQSLSNMTTRLQQLTCTAERKDSELLELRQTIELLRKQSVEAGLTSAYIQNMSPHLARRHTVTDGEEVAGIGVLSGMSRQLSADSVSSLNSLSSACSHSSSAHPSHACGSQSPGNKKKKGWLRSSFSKAFSRSKKNKNGSVSDVEDARGMHSDLSAPSSPLLNGGSGTLPSLGNQNTKLSQSSSAIYQGNGNSEKQSEEGPEVVEELRKQLREKDLVLTDIRLEALSSAHQLESLKDTVMKMRNEMLNLKQDNERLQRIVTSKSLTTSQCSLAMDSLERRFSMTDATNSNMDSVDFSSSMSMAALAALDPDGKRTPVAVFLGAHGSYERYIEESGESTQQMCNVAAIAVSGKTKWEVLDTLIKRLFKEYLSRVDPTTSLGLGTDSISSYHVGEVERQRDSPTPDLLPCGYLVGNADSITICLKGAVHNGSGSVDALAFETLIPKSIIQRYISLLTEHRRIILCGPSGTGKSYLANKLAEFLVLRSGKESTVESIATFNVDHKTSKELRQYLANVAEQCEHNAADLPSVIILDNLHHAASLGDVFNGFLNAKYNKCPFIIGTMNQATCSTTNLQLHHNFRWILCANHMEPVKGFLGRYLRRRLLETEAREGGSNADMTRVFDWIPKVWQHLNKFLEAHSSSDVTIGPRLFLACPTDLAGSQVWFTDLWNYSLVPYLLEAVREGLQLYGRRAPWEDPTVFISQTYPWTEEAVHGGREALLKLRAEDVGYDMQPMVGGGSSMRSISSTQSDTDGDPLLNMLMRLQEAANYSSPHSNDSDSASHESHQSGSHTSSVNNSLANPRLESTL